ncbi:uncharacterized protein BO80DRAFT_425370 [Aspergillus ibericus CBS 121593]|uniref:Uncharacterized protein n=1 Tax=Aspergillus ibericus CBS 121593 TaxID=1448316 RepID=A0A395GZF2_9EURO|nr:hypothetical protein BO80DRAFT_425370 [Aspergillus ibericus CBS 121593]RAL00971.1 hypothetical protein BO80DRAFT_425370 [Aspergillus ibericus CBS 121593]
MTLRVQCLRYEFQYSDHGHLLHRNTRSSLFRPRLPNSRLIGSSDICQVPWPARLEPPTPPRHFPVSLTGHSTTRHTAENDISPFLALFSARHPDIPRPS